MPAIAAHHPFVRSLLALTVLTAVVSAPALFAQSSSTEPGAATEPAQIVAATPEAPTALRSVRYVGSALKPRVNNVDYATNGSGGCVYATAGSAATVWNLPLFLPAGATVDFLRIYFDDTSASNLQGWFTIYDLFGNLVEEWGVSSSGAAGQNYLDSGAINHVIDYNAYSYVFNFRPVATGSTLQLCGVRIFYNY